jgi:phosphodiesterase/alkaline phosphatase D-like protein
VTSPTTPPATPTSERALPRRRTVLATGAAGAGLTLTTLPPDAQAARAARRRRRAVFAHGVASGDPLARRVVIWTRVTPSRQATPGSGRGPRITVEWEVARDRKFRRIVRRGSVVTSAARDHTVKVDVRGLRPGKRYFYRFRWRKVTSPVGRTQTAPRPRSTPRNLRFGIVSCSNLQAGWFSAYRHLAARDDLDAVLHLGDYIYEYAPGEYGHGQDNEDIRPHVPAREMVSLADYRQRHAQYKRDRDLQRLHGRYPFIVTWDDHEVTNDQWRRGAENHNEGEGKYLPRRARAHRAYDEWMPVRFSGTADLRDGTRLFRHLTFGRLAELSMIDLRTYRDEQTTDPTAIADPGRTITGKRQMRWLIDHLGRNHGHWKLVGNPVMITPVNFGTLPDDVTGPVADSKIARKLALTKTDGYVGDFVDMLKATGRWRSSIVIVLADHSMDWSRSDQAVAIGPALDADPMLAGRYAIAENGGAELVYWTGPARRRDEAVRRIRRAAKSVDGVLHAHPRTDRFLGLGPEAGDVVVYCEAGRRFSEDPGSNPIPGNHGHPTTLPIPFFIGGGHRRVPRGVASSDLAFTMDVAPTLSSFFGVGGPRRGYDGTNRLPRR